MGAVPEQQQPLPRPRVASPDLAHGADHASFLGRGMLEVPADDGEVEGGEELWVARPRLEQAVEALDAMEPPHRDDQRKAGPRTRQVADCGPEVAPGGRLPRPARRSIERPQRHAFCDRADPACAAAAAIDAEQLVQVRLALLPGEGDETVCLPEHRLDQVRAKGKWSRASASAKVSRLNLPDRSAFLMTCGSAAR